MNNALSSAIAAKSTAVIIECLKEFQKKGYVNMDDAEVMVEGALLQELLNRDEIEAADAHVEAM